MQLWPSECNRFKVSLNLDLWACCFLGLSSYNQINMVISSPFHLFSQAKMYEDPVRWGGMFQSYSQFTMLDLHTQPHVSIK